MRPLALIAIVFVTGYLGGYAVVRITYSESGRMLMVGDTIQRPWWPERCTVIIGETRARAIAYAYLPFIVLDTWCTRRPFAAFRRQGDFHQWLFVWPERRPPAFPRVQFD